MVMSWPGKVALIGALALALAGFPANAQEYPTRNVTIVVPLAAGSGMDLIVRIYGEELAKALGKPVVVENQPGAALMLAVQNVARAAPDGHTLVVSASPPMAVNPRSTRSSTTMPRKTSCRSRCTRSRRSCWSSTPAFGAGTMKESSRRPRTAPTL